MKHIFVRPIRPGDSAQFVEWSRNTKNNLFDADVPLYPTSVVRCAFDSSGPVVYAPLQFPVFIEALAINPNSSEMQIASGLKALTQDAVSQAYIRGSGEVYFVCKDESTIKLAVHHGYKEMPYKVYRIKLNDLEKPDKNTSQS